MESRLTLGPILFHWSADQKRDFYARIADEAPIDTVYMGEVICSKRAPFFDRHIDEVAQRLERGGKTVVISSLAEVMLKRERKAAADLALIEDREIEVNNSAELYHISGRPHRIGQYFNTYNEETMRVLAARGASHFSLPTELPRESVRRLARCGAELGTPVEVQVFGRASLALSARCYHARAHGRHKGNCMFVCEQDSDGMALSTINGQAFLTVNGIQTLSHSFVSLMPDLADMQAMGLGYFRLVPHSVDMVAVATIFRQALDAEITSQDAQARLDGLSLPAPFSNGFWHGRPGYQFVTSGQPA